MPHQHSARVALLCVALVAFWSAPATTGHRQQPVREKSPLGLYEQVTPDGVYGWSLDRKAGQLTLRHLTTGATRVLVSDTPSTRQVSFSWSRDGQQLAYSRCFVVGELPRCGGPQVESESELRIINVDGSASRVVLPRTAGSIEPMDWSPDGEYVLAMTYRKSHGSLAIISVGDGSITEIKRGGETMDVMGAAFSPDGRHIVYGAYQDTVWWGLTPFEVDAAKKDNLHVIDVDTGEDTVLIDHPADEHFMGWAPSGSSVLFTSDRSGTIDLWIAPFKDGRIAGSPERLLQDVGAIEPKALLANGDFHYREAERIRFSAQLVRLDSAAPELSPQPIETTRREHQGPITFSPDGKTWAYLSGTDIFDTMTTRSGPTGDVLRTRIPLPTARVATQLWLAPGGTAYVLVGPTRGAATKQLARLDANGGALIPLGNTGEEAALWPDGQSIAYVRGGPGRVVQRPLEDGTERVLFNTGADGKPSGLSVAPDGTHIAVITGPPGTQAIPWVARDLRIVDIATGTSTVIARPRSRDDSRQRTTWSPDGTHVYYVDHPTDDEGHEELWRVPRTGGTATKLLTSPCAIVGPSVHPSGTFLTFTSECVSPGGPYIVKGLLPPAEHTGTPGGLR